MNMRSLYLTLLALIFHFSAFTQGSSNISLVYQWSDTTLPATSAHLNTYNEIWGVVQGGREYAIIGSTMGTHIFDITDIANVDTAVFIPGAATGQSLVHRDYHDYNGYLYIVADEDSQLTLSTLQIVDLSYLPDSAPVVYDSNVLFKNSHNIFIDTATARLYVSGSRSPYKEMRVYDLTPDPLDPILIDSYDRGRHDVYVRNDTAYLNDGTSGLYIVDFATPGNPIVEGTHPADSGYNHSGWLSEDGSVYALAYESFGFPINLLDVSDMSNITILSTISSGVNALSIPHNLIIRDTFLYASYYNDGLYIFDISDPVNPSIAGFYDTSTELHINGNYRGAWGVYPLLPSGLVLVSDMQNGLYVLDVSQAVNPVGIDDNDVKAQKLVDIHPNPFNEMLVISIDWEKNTRVRVEIFNELGALVSSSYEVPFNGELRLDTEKLSTGLYEVSVTGDGLSESHKLIKTR